MPELACLNGPSNLGAFYPLIPSKTDLGPKLYIAHRGNMGESRSPKRERTLSKESKRNISSSDDLTSHLLSCYSHSSYSSSIILSPCVSEPGGRGSTGLHLDVSDAVNMMPDAPLPQQADGSPNPNKGGACWDIFRAEDSDGLRDFLREKFGLSKTMDPIHSQLYYIDLKLRKELWDSKKIKSWRFVQQVGEAVFIPAGCAHQVSFREREKRGS